MVGVLIGIGISAVVGFFLWARRGDRPWVNKSTLGYRITVTIPLAFFSIADGIVMLLTLGYIMPEWKWHYAMRVVTKEAWRERYRARRRA